MENIHSKIDDLFMQYLNNKGSRWELANKILYDMCEKHPLHNNEDEIVAKLWIIGRTYAAALERRKNSHKDKSIDIYYDLAAPAIKRIQRTLDESIEKINNSGNITEILRTHKILVDLFKELTALEKRSLASKYLHFHCKEKVFIYDSIANISLSKLVKRPDRSFLKTMDVDSYDKTYADFIARILALKNYLENHLRLGLSPRELDSFLLSKIVRDLKK